MTPERFHAVVISILIVIAFNLFLLDYKVFLARSSPAKSDDATSLKLKEDLIQNPTAVPTISPYPTSIKETQCTPACTTYVADEISRLEKKIPDPKFTLEGSPANQAKSPKELYIPFGSATGTKDSWQDITGSDTSINIANYPGFKQAFFETSIYVPTGNGKVSARLFNVTANHTVGNSEVGTERSTPTKFSTQVQLDGGDNVYRLQMQSTLKYEAKMDMGRVKIVVE